MMNMQWRPCMDPPIDLNQEACYRAIHMTFWDLEALSSNTARVDHFQSSRYKEQDAAKTIDAIKRTVIIRQHLKWLFSNEPNRLSLA